MKAAVIHQLGSAPTYEEFRDPVPQAGAELVRVCAAALSNLARSQAMGTHYSSSVELPFIPGVDGVGEAGSGQRVYFAFPFRPDGAFAELSLVPSQHCVPLPDNLDEVQAAALANPGMSCWAALTERAKLTPGETVLVNGATGTSGRLAVQVAKILGAGKVVATGRNREVLDALSGAGADVVISLEQSDSELLAAFQTQLAAGVHIILDYLWGRSAESLIKAAAGRGSLAGEPPLRFVQIGSAGGATLSFPAQALRSSGLVLLGSGLGSVSAEGLLQAIGAFLNVVVPANLRAEVETLPLADVQAGWDRRAGGKRLVFTM